MSVEDKEIIQRFGKAISALNREDQKYMLGRAEAMADRARDAGIQEQPKQKEC